MKYTMTHTCIRVFDLEKSLEFYEKALGLKEVKRKENAEYKFTLVFVTDEQGNHEIELTYNHDQEKPYDIGNGYSHIAFYVEDIEKSHENHKALGYQVTDIKKALKNGSDLYFVTDPDGYKVELIQKSL